MRRWRQGVSMATAALAVLAMGFVVAVAAQTLPGGTGVEPVLDLDFRANVDLSPVLAWILVVLAVLGAVLFAFGLRRNPTREGMNRRSLVGTLIGLILFVVIARWLRPAAEALLDQGAGVADSANEVLDDNRVGSAGGWLFSILLAAVIAAALTRIGLSIRTVPSVFQPEEQTEVVAAIALLDHTPVPSRLGPDPRSRVIAAYEAFENKLTASGRPRADSETTARHAHRAGDELSLDANDLDRLVRHHSQARFGNQALSESDAREAEQAAARLQAAMSK